MIGMLLICLVLSLPIVSAQQLNIISVGGKDAPDGYIKSYDNLNIQVKAKIPYDSNIGREQVQLWIDDAFAFFDSCEKEADTATHTCTYEQDGFRAFSRLDFVFKLVDDDSQIVAQKTKTIRVDAVKPSVKVFDADPLVSTGHIRLQYTAEDYSYTAGDTSECSGIRNITVTADGSTISSELGQVGQCKKSNTLSLDLQKSQKLCIIVQDYVGYETSGKCLNVIIDKNAPNITVQAIQDQKGNPITHLKGTAKATITARITDESEVAKASVSANFGSISTEKSDKTATRITGDLYIWDSITLTGGSPCIYSIRAKDKLGNTDNRQFSCRLTQDNTGPSFIGLVPPPATYNSFPLYGKGTSLQIEFEDKDDENGYGVGMGARRAYLDLSSLGLGTLARADACLPSQTSNERWICSWTLRPGQSVQEGDYTIKVAQATADDFDNAIQAVEQFTIYYDNTPPMIPIIKQFEIVKSPDQPIAGPVRGNYARYVVESANFTQSLANFSDLGGPDNKPAIMCTDTDAGTQECEFEQLIDYSGPYLAEIMFNFIDAAGNNASTATQLEVFGIDNESKGKFWKPTVTCSPQLIDRASASIIPPYISCRVSLEPLRKDVQTLAIQGPTDTTQCAGTDIQLNLNDVYLSNTQEGTTDPYMIFKLNSKDYYITTLNITCPLNVFTKKIGPSGSSIVPLPQVITVNLTTGFYNVPQNDLYNAVDEKIAESLDNSFATADWLGTLRDFLYYAELTCNIKSVISSVIGVLYAVAGMLGIESDALKKATVTYPAGTSLEQGYRGLCNVEEVASEVYSGVLGETLIEILDQVCSLINCQVATNGKQAGLWEGGALKWCSDVNELFNLLPAAGAANKAAGTPAITIKDSLFWSTICLCIPGIVYNLEKLRQVYCYETVCYNDEVKAQGYPVSYCGEMKDYLMCQYVIGQIWASVPFSALADTLIEMVVDVVSDPLMLVTTALGWVCKEVCDAGAESAFLYILCALYKTTAIIGEATGAVMQMTETKDYFKSPHNAYCGRAEEIADEFEDYESKQSAKEIKNAPPEEYSPGTMT